MNAADKSRSEPERGELRRRQVLDAAAECFRREGFHGTSISRITRASGMSPGHIYHYFVSKEAIVQAIAERDESDLADLVSRVEQDQAGGDLVTRLTRQTAETVARDSDPARIGLMLELAAEAARNPAVASILRHSDQAIEASFLDMVKRVGLPAGLDEAELRLRMGMVAALFQGLALRSTVDPQRDQAAVVHLLNKLIRCLLEEP
jgi:TetR/AcrR family transcriptional repressor of uid operon